MIIGESAKQDVDGIYRTIANDKPVAAKNWVREFRRLVRSLTSMPERFEVIPEAEELDQRLRHLRHVIFGNYRIIYEIQSKTVNIVRVFHAARLLQHALRENLP